MMYIVYLECNISDWYSPNTLGRCRLTGQPFNPTVGRLVITPTYPVGRLVTTPFTLSADWSTLQPHCRLTGHHSYIPCRPTGQPFNPTVSHLVITPSPLVADWSSLQHTLLADWSPLHPHCWPTGHLSNIPCQPTGHHSNPTVGRLVTSPIYPVGRPISPTTPLLADWSL